MTIPITLVEAALVDREIQRKESLAAYEQQWNLPRRPSLWQRITGALRDRNADRQMAQPQAKPKRSPALSK